MNPDMEKKLETEIGGALRGLPDLAAPPGFFTRTMKALEQPAPRHARPWTQWPAPARIAFLTLALAAVAAAVAGWRAVEPGILAVASRRLAPAVSVVECFWDVLGALAGAAVPTVKQLGSGFLLACLAAAAWACAVCAGFGTMCVRLALARPGKNQL